MDKGNHHKAMAVTLHQYDGSIKDCRDIFQRKMRDYGPSWRVLRPESVTDQIYIKVNRIRTLEDKGDSKVGDGVFGEYQAIVNYSVIGLIQLSMGHAEKPDLTADEAMTKYDDIIQMARDLMIAKNHDYGEAWREMRLKGITDLIFVKVIRLKQIEDNGGKTEVSEGTASNLLDILNYAAFALIRLGN